MSKQAWLMEMARDLEVRTFASCSRSDALIITHEWMKKVIEREREVLGHIVNLANLSLMKYYNEDMAVIREQAQNALEDTE